MKLFGKFRKKEKIEEKPKKESLERKVTKKISEKKHLNRISNLNGELDALSDRLKFVEASDDIQKAERDKESDRLIRRMVFIKYEIEIREELLKWL